MSRSTPPTNFLIPSSAPALVDASQLSDGNSSTSPTCSRSVSPLAATMYVYRSGVNGDMRGGGFLFPPPDHLEQLPQAIQNLELQGIDGDLRGLHLLPTVDRTDMNP